jgi:hypothetical protein
LWDLEQIFTWESFKEIENPLINIVMGENGETMYSILSFFLESLHSNSCAAAIKDLKNSTNNVTLLKICNAQFIPDITAEEN